MKYDLHTHTKYSDGELDVAGNVETDIFGRMQTPLQALGKPMTPSAEELAQNPRSRSAKMRIGVKRYDTLFKE